MKQEEDKDNYVRTNMKINAGHLALEGIEYRRSMRIVFGFF